MSAESGKKRRLLQALGAWGVAATLPEKWIKPTVDSVLLPAHAQTTQQLDCEITRGEEGSAPRVSGGTFIIDTNIEFFNPELAVGDTLDARHRVPAAGYDEVFPSTVTETAGRLFGGNDIPFSIPTPAGVAPGQNLIITVTMTSGELAGLSCEDTLDIE